VIGYVTAGLVFVALGVYLGYSAWQSGGFWTWVGAVVSGVIGLILGFSSKFREGPCPACGQLNMELKEGEFRRCFNTKCQRYLQGDGVSLWLVSDDVITSAPTFGAVLPEKFGWPPGCCVCGQPATRVISISLHVKETGRKLATTAAGLALGRIVIKTGGGTIVSVNTPHCESHMDGAALEDPAVGSLRILFRSHQYQQQFRTHNKVAVD
jgi:ssDNA-binding Zn-finger/Zn-ribbon topoisomerase 1